MFIVSLSFNLFVGWSPLKGEPVIVTGIKRIPSIYTRVAYPEVINDSYKDVEQWYNEVGLPIMYRSYNIGMLENDFSMAHAINLISSIWVFILAVYLGMLLYYRIWGLRL